MSAPRQKTDILLERLRSGDTAGAISIARTFKGLPKEQRAIIARAHEARHSPRLYAQMGKDPAALIAAGDALLSTLYGARL